MANFTDLLGSLMQAGMSDSRSTRITNAFGGSGSGGGLNDLLGSLGQMLGGGKAQTSGGGNLGSGGNLGGVIGSVLESLGSNKAVVGGLGALVGAVLGGGGSATRGAIGGGSLAMLASLAFAALKNAGQQPPPPAALMEDRTPQQNQRIEEDAMTIVKAMINAAKADGQIDDKEVVKITGKLNENGLTDEEREFFTAEINQPLDLQGLIASARHRPELAAQIYAASLLAIEVDTDAERQYLQALASGLQLPPQSVAYIESTLGVA
ncbi:MAG: tellurite resistance TerB family protein [Candidatus Competibacteraceae bacterium]|nr:tellurite resistance TerB family protein [Candidatus Competibacteraceae bacterium]